MVTGILHLASGAVEGIIWLIIIVLWGLAQMVNAIKNSQKKNGGPPRQGQPKRPESRTSQGGMPTSLPEILESMFGQERPQPQAPPPPPASAPESDQSPNRPTVYKNSAAQKEQQRKVQVERDAEQADAFAIRSSKSSVGMRSFKLPNFKLPATGSMLQNSSSGSKPTINFNLRDNANFKRAILTRTILGPPKSLKDDPFLSEY